jgi:hypothetical protein
MMNQKELRIQRDKILSLANLAKRLGGLIDVDGEKITIQELQELLKDLDKQIAIESSKLDNLVFLPNRKKNEN